MLTKIIPCISLLSMTWFSCFLEAQQSPGLLVMNMSDESILPRNFRTTSAAFKINTPPLPSREGLDGLKLSGSAQFSEKSLETILKHLNHPAPFYILDLREEYHGFMNGTAVSWYGMRDWSNVGKSQEEIEQGEQKLLDQALKQKDIVLGRIINKDIEDNEQYDFESIPFKVTSVATEQQLASKLKVNYKRLTVTDHAPPSPYYVDRFISFVKQLPPGAWLHIHCAAGVGRTTTFMAMYDMMKNAKNVSFDDIIKREWYIGGRNLSMISGTLWKHQLTIERAKFIKEFYNYCRNNQDNFETTWSLYLLLKTSHRNTPA